MDRYILTSNRSKIDRTDFLCSTTNHRMRYWWITKQHTTHFVAKTKT